MDLEDANSPTTRLLTLLNVSALKSKKRPTEDLYPREKLNKRKCPNSEPEPSGEQALQPSDGKDAAEQEVDEYQVDQNDLARESLPCCSVSRRLSQSRKYTIHMTNILVQPPKY